MIEPMQPIEASTLYSLSQICWETSDWKTALDEIIRSIRPHFIFDNIAVYIFDHKTNQIEIKYAKATGRGKSKEADVAWGEAIINEVMRQGKTILQEPQDNEQDRLSRPYLLGIPLQSKDSGYGVVVFVRFGNPEFTADHIRFAEYMSQQISSMILRSERETMIVELEEHINTLQVQDDFISTLSHELKNPIGFIKGYTTTLLRKDTTWSRDIQMEFLHIIDTETDRLGELIDNLLDSSRLQSGKIQLNLQIIRLDALLNDVVAHAHIHHPQVDIKLDIRQELPNIMGDPRRLKQVFDNIISNSAKYAPESGVHIRVYRETNGISLDFRDRGPGIPTKDLDKVFERFYRSDAHLDLAQGSGLGLFICKKIIEAHGGEINASSMVGKGTTFHIFLPMEKSH